MESRKRLTALIVDDESLARENLKLLLDEFCPAVEVVGMAGGVIEAKQKISDLKPKVVFLDIRMPSGAEGFELLESITDKSFQVVFVTAFKDYAIEALNANAIHYLLKPIDIEDLQHAVSKLVEYEQSFADSDVNLSIYLQIMVELTSNMLDHKQPAKLTLFHSKGFNVVNTVDILRLEADGGCSAFFFADGSKYLDTKTLKTYEDILDSHRFIRVHKSHILNLDHLKEYSSHDGHFAIMSDGSQVPIARARLSAFLTQTKRIG
jgi:two-component system LytT family response regulator